MYIRKRIMSLLLSFAILAAMLPSAGAAGTEPEPESGTIRGSISATLRVDYAQSLDSLQKRAVKAELLRDGKSLGEIPLTEEQDGVALLDGGSASVSLRNRDGGELGGGNWPGYLDLTASGLPTGTYTLKVTGRGFAPLQEQVELKDFDRHVILGTGDLSFPAGDVDGSGRVDEQDRKLLEAALGSTGQQDLERCDLNGDGKVNVYDLACVTRNAAAAGGAQLLNTAMLSPSVGSVQFNSNAPTPDWPSLFQDDGQAVKIPKDGETGQAELYFIMDRPEEMEEIQIRTPESSGGILEGTATVTGSDGSVEEIPFNITPPDGVRAISTGVIRIALGRRVAVKEITITVTKTIEGDYASVESIRFLRDIVPENPVQPNSEIKNLKAEPGDEQVSLRWDPLPNLSGYRVDYWLRDGGETRSLLVDVPEAVVTGLENLKTYFFTVTPIDKGWEGKPSAIVSAEPLPAKVPDAPDMVTVIGLDGGLNVSWKKGKSATYYEVFYKTSGEETYSQWKDDTWKDGQITETSVSLTGLTNGETYSIYIVAGNAIGKSGPSRISEGMPKATDYSRPEGIPTMGLLDNSKIESIRLADAGNYNAGEYTSDAPFQAQNMIDGDFRTHWTASSNWSRDEHVICTFTEPVDLSAAIWVPRLDGSYPNNLRAYSVRVWQDGDDLNGPGTQIVPDPVTGISDAAGSAHAWPNVPNYNTVASSRFAIMPFGQLKNVTKISVAAEQKNYLCVSCSELIFMEYDESRSLPDEINKLFASPLCTELAENITQADIDALRERLNSDERNYYLYPGAMEDQLNLAEELLQGETTGALLHGVDSRSGSADAKYSQGGSDLQPLGATAGAGSEVVIYASGIPAGQSLTVYASQFNAEANTWRALMGTLSNGQNVLTVPKIGSQNTPRGGSLYFTYSGSGAENISLHVRKAVKIPMLDLSGWYTLSEESRKAAIASYTDQLAEYVSTRKITDANKTTDWSNVTEIATPTVLLSLPAAAVLNAVGTAASQEERVNTIYQSVLAWEDIMYICKTTQGIDLNYEANDMQTRQNIRVMQMFAGAFMYAAGNHIGIGYGSCGGMVCGKPISSLPAGASANQLFGWGIAHEIGHNMDKLGRAEITNNIYSIMVQTYDGNQNVLPSRLEKSGKYPAIFTKTAQSHPGESGDVFVQLGMYWQLHLAYDEGSAPMDFYNRFFKAWKSGTYFNGASGYSDRVALTASAVANRDLSEFFTRWGMTLSPDTLNSLKSYPTENRAVWYLNDQSRRDRLEGLSGADGTVSLTVNPSAEYPNNGFDLSISCTGNADRIQGYEILRNGESIAFVTGGTASASFTDIVGSANHRTYQYSVRAYDTLGYCFAEGGSNEVRVSYDKTIPADRFYSISRDSDIITFELTDETAVSGVKFTGGSLPASGNFTVTVTDKDGKSTTARSGSFSNDENLSGSGYLAYFQKPGASASDTRIWTYDAKTVTITGIPDSIETGNVQLIPYADDDVAFLEGEFAGILSEDYDTGSEIIPAGTMVIAGTYQGDPVYQVLKVQGRFVDNVLEEGPDGEAVVKETEEIRDLDGKTLLFAEIPEDGQVSDISDGIFLFIPNLEKEEELQGEISSCAPKSLLPAQLRVQSYRTDTPDSTASGRLTAQTLWTDSPGGTELPTLVLEVEG